MDPAVLAERLLLCVYGYGTNTGIKAAAAGDHGHSENDLRCVRRRFLSAESARAMAVQIANATFAVRSEQVWGTGSTAVASDSTHFGACDQNIFAQWHSRYGTGVGAGFPGDHHRRVAASQQLATRYAPHLQPCRIRRVVTGFLEKFV